MSLAVVCYTVLEHYERLIEDCVDKWNQIQRSSESDRSRWNSYYSSMTNFKGEWRKMCKLLQEKAISDSNHRIAIMWLRSDRRCESWEIPSVDDCSGY